MNYHIDIDGSIGAWEYSKDYVKRKLEENKGKPVNMRMCSNGGSLQHGLAMCDRVSEHGDVTAYLMGFNASAATLAVLKAKKVCMASNGFYLIHKVMSPIDIWDMLNADEMEALIQELIADKLENEKIDKVVAQMYAEKTGKTIDDILKIMKIGGWMNATEALAYGFVDEIINTNEKVNMVQMKEKFNAIGLPTNRITNEELFPTNNKNQMKKQPVKINEILKVESFESNAEGVFLNEEQIHTVDARIVELENSVATAATENANLENRATTAEATIAERDVEIANLTAQVETLKKTPGDTSQQNTKAADDAKTAASKNDFLQNMSDARELYNMLP
jgi:ATP-dependent protease ClpP protease subunit